MLSFVFCVHSAHLVVTHPNSLGSFLLCNPSALWTPLLSIVNYPLSILRSLSHHRHRSPAPYTSPPQSAHQRTGGNCIGSNRPQGTSHRTGQRIVLLIALFLRYTVIKEHLRHLLERLIPPTVYRGRLPPKRITQSCAVSLLWCDIQHLQYLPLHRIQTFQGPLHQCLFLFQQVQALQQLPFFQ